MQSRTRWPWPPDARIAITRPERSPGWARAGRQKARSLLVSKVHVQTHPLTDRLNRAGLGLGLGLVCPLIFNEKINISIIFDPA